MRQQQQEEEEQSFPPLSLAPGEREGEGWDEVDNVSVDESIEMQDKNKKSFSVGSIEVGGV